jgi:hypothetical protein
MHLVLFLEPDDVIYDTAVVLVGAVAEVQAEDVYSGSGELHEVFVGVTGWAYGGDYFGILVVDHGKRG